MPRPDGRMPTKGIQNPIPTIVEIKEGEPDGSLKQNPEITLDYDNNGTLVSIINTINNVNYQRVLSYDADGLLINVTAWAEI